MFSSPDANAEKLSIPSAVFRIRAGVDGLVAATKTSAWLKKEAIEGRGEGEY